MKRKTLVTIICIALAVFLAVPISFAWFSDSLNTNTQIETYVHKSYFESGDGTAARQYQTYDNNGDPIIGIDSETGEPLTTQEGCAFEIKYPVQLYYFAWLQALGYFNTPKDGNDTISQVYFYLSDDLDMKDWVLPQVGTQTYPFVGNFNGNGHTISNLRVRNVEGSGIYGWTDKPSDVDGLNIVGFFGVIGSLYPTGENADTVNGAVVNGTSFTPTAGYAYDISANEVKNFVIEDATIQTDLSNSLAGIAAGYVNGKMENVKVVGGTLSSTATESLSYTTNLSDYGAVGFCTNAYKDTNNVTTVILYDPQVYSNAQGSANGQDNNWGDSINMKSMYEDLLDVYQGYATQINSQQAGKNIITIEKTDGEVTGVSVTGDGTAQLMTMGYNLKVVEKKDGNDTISYFSLVERSTNFMYLYGGTTYTTQDINEDAFYIHTGESTPAHYLSMNNSFNIIDSNSQNNDSKWIIKDGKIYTIRSKTITDPESNIETSEDYFYYLIKNGNNELEIVEVSQLENTPANVTDSLWTIDENSITTGGYALIYSGGSWTLSQISLYISDNDGNNFLSASSTPTIVNQTTSGNATQWTKESVDGNTIGFYLATSINGTKYYLLCNNSGIISLGTSNPTIWYEDAPSTGNHKVYTLTESTSGFALYYDISNGWSTTGYSTTGQGSDWGGSIDMFSMFSRLKSIESLAEGVDETEITIEHRATSDTRVETIRYENAFRNYEAENIGSFSFSRSTEEPDNYVFLFGQKYKNLITKDYTTTNNAFFLKNGTTVTTYYAAYINSSGNPVLRTFTNQDRLNPSESIAWYSSNNVASNKTTTYSYGVMPTYSTGTVLGNVYTILDGNVFYLNITSSATLELNPTSNGTTWTWGGSDGRRFQGRYNNKTYQMKTNFTLVQSDTNGGGNLLVLAKEIPNITTSFSNELSDINPTFFPINANSSTYTVLSSNTGYVISGSSFEENAYPDYSGDIRVARYSMSSITNPTEPYTINTNGRSNDMSAFTKYNEAYSSLLKMFTTDPNYIYGLHFMDARIDISKTVTIPTAVINGVSYTNYVMPTDCIDFKLKEKGFINFFAGTYFSGNNAFFSLHRITRNADNTLSTIKEITTIYNPSGTDTEYIYLYDDGSYSSNRDRGSVAFDTSWLTNPTSFELDKLYYFEIPVNSGEYALGSIEGKNGAYLMYLDISASATIEGDSKIVNNMNITNTTDAGQLSYTELEPTENETPTYFPLAWKRFGEGNNHDYRGDVPADTNTGYVISGSNTSAAIPGDIRVSQYSKYAAGNWASIRSSLTSQNNAGILNDSAVYTIIDGEQNNISEYGIGKLHTMQYGSVSKTVNELLEGNQYVYGLHFMKAQISKDKTVTVPKAIINGVTKTNYVMPQDSIDFKVSTKGRIAFMAGTYYSGSSGVQSFFSLHRIFRDGNDNIISIKQLSEIYTDGDASHGYIYRYKGDSRYYNADGTLNGNSIPSGYTLIYDLRAIDNPTELTGNGLTQNSVYYFEIPVDAGEYALGSSDSDGAYLIYLDIAAGASFAVQTTTKEVSEQNEYEMTSPKGVAFVDDANSTAFNDGEGNVDSSKSVFISIPVGANSNGNTSFDITSDGAMTVTADSSLSGYAPQSIPIGTSLSVNGSPATMPVTRKIITEKVTIVSLDLGGTTTTTITTTVQTIENGVTNTVVTQTVTTEFNGVTTTQTTNPAPTYDGHELLPKDMTSNENPQPTADIIFEYSISGDNLTHLVARNGELVTIETTKSVQIDDKVYNVYNVENGNESAGRYDFTISGTAGSYNVNVNELDSHFDIYINGTKITSTGSQNVAVTASP